MLLCIIICLIIVGYGQMIFSFIPAISIYNEVGLFTRMASLSFGALIAIYSSNYFGKIIPTKLHWLHNNYIEWAFAALLIFTLLTQYQLKPVILGFCSCYIVLKSVHSKFKIPIVEWFLTNKFVVYIGSISYGIYIYHLPINYYFTKYLFKPIILQWLYQHFATMSSQIRQSIWMIKLPILLFLTILVAHLSCKFIEKPILQYKNKLFGNE